MGHGVARYRDHVEGECTARQLDAVAFGHAHIGAADARVDGGVDRRAGGIGQLCGAADVIGVMMGEHDRAQAPTPLRQRRLHGCRCARIDHERVAGSIGAQPDVVVGESGQGEQ